MKTKALSFAFTSILVMFGISCFTFLNKMSTQKHKEEYLTLSKLKEIVNEIPGDKYDSEFYLEEKVNGWLKSEHAKEADKNFIVRDTLVQLLRNFGVKASSISEVKSGDAPKFSLLEIWVDSRAFQHDSIRINSSSDTKEYFEVVSYLNKPTIIVFATSIKKNDEYKRLARQDDIQEETDTTDDSSEFDDEFEEDRDDISPLQGFIDLYSVDMRGDTCRISYQMGRNAQTGGQKPIFLSMITDKIDGPKLYNLYGITDAEFEAIFRGNRTDVIKEKFAHVPIDQSIDISLKEFMKAYENVDVFGFSFNTSGLPVGLAVFHALIAILVAICFLQANKQDAKNELKFNGDSVFDIIISGNKGRVIAFIILPIASVILSYPLSRLTYVEHAIIVSCSIMVFTVYVFVLRNVKSPV